MSRTPHVAGRSKVPESGVLRACLDLLSAEKIWHRRWNTGAVKIGTRFFRFGEKGDADILAAPQQHNGYKSTCHIRFDKKLCLSECCPDPKFLWIECKSACGRQTPEQKEFQEEVEAAGHIYLLVRDVDTLRDWLKEHGR